MSLTHTARRVLGFALGFRNLQNLRLSLPEPESVKPLSRGSETKQEPLELVELRNLPLRPLGRSTVWKAGDSLPGVSKTQILRQEMLIIKEVCVTF